MGDTQGPKFEPGYISLTVHKARNLEKKGFFGKPDPYVSIKFGKQSFKSEALKNQYDPEWEFKAKLDVEKMVDHLVFVEVLDEDIGHDDTLGKTNFDIHELLDKEGIVNQWVPLESCKSGEILISASYITKNTSILTLERENKEEILGKNIKVDQTITSKQNRKSIVFLTEGTLGITVHDARNLGKKKSDGKPTTLVFVTFGEQESKTKVVKKNNNPTYNFNTKFNVNKNSAPYLNFEVFDYIDISRDESMGNLKLNIQDIFVNQPTSNQWMPLENSKSGEIRISISFTDLETRDSEKTKSVHFKDVSTSESKTENLPSDILALKEENRELQSHIPEEILSNLPPEFREMLQAEVVKARQTMLEEELEKPKTEEKENESPEVNKNTTEVEEILDLVKDLDEDTSKFIYEQLQTILVEIDQELKQQKMKDLREELTQLQIQQNKIMPGLPDDLISSLPKELSDELQKSMKDAYLKMASTNVNENDKESEIEHNVTEVLNNDGKDLDNKPTVTITSDEVIMSSIPEDLLANLPPEMANALKLNFASSIKMLSAQNDKDGESEEEDDVSLPPTPAVQTPWSVVANQPARPSGPTPDSELREDKTTGPFNSVVKKQTTVVVKEERKISNNVVKRSLFAEDYEGDKQTLKAPEKDYRSVSPEIIEVAKSTVEKVIEGAKIKVTEISGRETEHTGDIDLTGTHVPAENTRINPDLLDIAQEAVVNIIEDAKTKVVNIKTKESKNASNKSPEQFQEVEIIKNRISKDEDRFS